jgi:hypothetical protein
MIAYCSSEGDAPVCDEGFRRSTLALAESESNIEGIGRFLDEVPADLPRRSAKGVIPGVVPADAHQPDEAALTAAQKCTSSQAACCLLCGR